MYKRNNYPRKGLIELTYRCYLNCAHCYCGGSKSGNKELSTEAWKKIFHNLCREGCLELVFSGGDPLKREDFLDLYAFIKKKGFIVTIFTTGQWLNKKLIAHLVKSPPYSMEITLNGITKKTYESITRIPGSFEKVIANIKEVKKRGLPLILKTNCLKQNKYELGRIKAFADKLLGKSRGRYHFKYDPMIYPRLNGERSPCAHRLSFDEIMQVRKQDPDIWAQYQKTVKADMPDISRDKNYLYRCNSWMSQFFINPYGRLKFCNFSDKFSVDLRTSSFKEGFYNIFPRLLREKFKTESKCINCKLRPICYHCPARAYLETGDEEAPVPYYCELAKATAREMEKK